MLKVFINSFNAEYKVKKKKKYKPVLLYLLIFILIAALAFVGVKYGPAYVADRQLEKQAQAVLAQDPIANSDRLVVKAKRGTLVLSGSVNSIVQRTRIDSTLRAIPQVRDITNNLHILKSHAELTESINQLLAPYRADGENDIRFIVEGDRVILEGYVPNPQTRSDISRLVSDIEGVSSVINNLSDTRRTEIEKLESFLQNNTIYFDSNQRELDAEHFRALNYIAAKMALMQNRTLRVSGYSDNLASPAYNLKLSQERADVVATYLIDKQMSQEKIEIVYFGKDNPAASNESEKGRALNRRVELTLTGS